MFTIQVDGVRFGSDDPVARQLFQPYYPLLHIPIVLFFLSSRIATIFVFVFVPSDPNSHTTARFGRWVEPPTPYPLTAAPVTAPSKCSRCPFGGRGEGASTSRWQHVGCSPPPFQAHLGNRTEEAAAESNALGDACRAAPRDGAPILRFSAPLVGWPWTTGGTGRWGRGPAEEIRCRPRFRA